MRPLVALLLLFLSPLACSAQPDLSRLKLPPGFHISLYADTRQSPRFMALSPGGVLLVASDDEGAVLALPDPQHTGRAARVVTVLSQLNGPHSLTFHQGKLYVAEIGKLVRYDWDEQNLRAGNGRTVTQLPGGGGHISRTVLFHNGKLYVAAGSSCNVCVEDDRRRAAVLEFNQDGTGERIFARGLRNSVGLAVNPVTRTIWATENGRDWLGDDLPPEEINDLGKNGGDFGWPYCYGQRVVDSKFPGSSAERCAATIPAKFEMQAHSAPLGLAFYTAEMFPAEYRGDLFVAFHGSWNRSEPTGYKVVRVKINSKGEPEGIEDFITGWLPPGATKGTRPMGRPVGIVIGSDGAMYVSDDAGGAIYRVTYGGKR